MKNKNEPWQNSRFWLQQYARSGNGAKGEAGQGRGTGWKQVGKEGAAAGGWDGKTAERRCRFVPYVPVRRGTSPATSRFVPMPPPLTSQPPSTPVFYSISPSISLCCLLRHAFFLCFGVLTSCRCGMCIGVINTEYSAGNHQCRRHRSTTQLPLSLGRISPPLRCT